jgi:2-polyprenyl-3-methyl-5-hydroxy-6-metoxy-1,4-benzoquinol methylase
MKRRGQLRISTAYSKDILNELKIKPKIKVLDIGSGIGFHSGIAALKGAEVIPIDIEKKKQGFQKYHPQKRCSESMRE